MNVNIALQVNGQLDADKNSQAKRIHYSLFTIHQYQTFTFNSYL